MKLLQLNIEKGRFLNVVIDYVKRENFDVLHFQEVTSGRFSYDAVDCYQLLQKALTDYTGYLSPAWGLVDDPHAFYTNATFIKKQISVIKTKELRFRRFSKIAEIPGTNNPRWMDKPCTALCLLAKIDEKPIWFINTHLPWSPIGVDTAEKSELGNKIYDFIKNESQPFILSGDFNILPGTKLINRLNTIGRNLIQENNIVNTLNPKTHRAAKQVFPPGLAVDFIFVDRSLTVENFHVVDRPTLSDHLGLFLDFIPA